MVRLIPREAKFYDLFEQQSQHILTAARLLYELLHDFHDVPPRVHAIKEVEHPAPVGGAVGRRPRDRHGLDLDLSGVRPDRLGRGEGARRAALAFTARS
jgi:hypothetical protein